MHKTHAPQPLNQIYAHSHERCSTAFKTFIYPCTQIRKHAHTYTRTKLLARFPFTCACVSVSVFDLPLSHCSKLLFLFFICFVFYHIAIFAAHAHTHTHTGQAFTALTRFACFLIVCTLVYHMKADGTHHSELLLKVFATRLPCDTYITLHYNTHTKLEKSQVFKHGQEKERKRERECSE